MKRNWNTSFIPQHFFLLGTSFGAMVILARWMTGNAFISSDEILVRYGLFFGVPYMFSYGIALVLVSLLISKVDFIQTEGNSLIERIDTRLKGGNKHVFRFFSYFMQLELWLLQLIMLYTFSLITTGRWAVHLTLFFLIILLIVSTWGHLQSYLSVTIFFIVILLITVTFVPIYYFVLNGAGKVYEGIRLYHPYLLYMKNINIIPLFVSFFFISIAQVLFDLPTWQNIALVRKEKRQKAFLTAGIIKLLLSFSFTAILMLAIFKGPFINSQVLSFSFLAYEDTRGFKYLFGLFAILASLIGLYHSINAMKKSMKKRMKLSTKIVLIMSMCLVVFVIDYFSVLSIIFFFGAIYIVLLPFILVLLYTDWLVPKFSFIIILIEVILAELLLYYGQPMISLILYIMLPTAFYLISIRYMKHSEKPST